MAHSSPRLTADDDHNSLYLHCYQLSYINKSHFENGNKVIMPASVLHIIMSSQNIKYGMTFEISNMETGDISHCGVLEFSAEEGYVFVPNWMMDKLSLKDGQTVKIVIREGRAKATYIKSLSDPKAVLEKSLIDFACLNIGDTIMVNRKDESYPINTAEASPENVVSLFQTDCEVDFARLLDYKEPEQHKEEVKKHTGLGSVSTGFTPFTGKSRRLDGETSSTNTSASSTNTCAIPIYDELGAVSTAFTPFTGVSRCLDEKTSSTNTCVIPKYDVSIEMTKVVDANLRKHDGTVVFGRRDSDGCESKKRKIAKMMEDVQQIEINEERFQPCTGKKCKLSY